jgi:hypothetical protein
MEVYPKLDHFSIESHGDDWGSLQKAFCAVTQPPRRYASHEDKAHQGYQHTSVSKNVWLSGLYDGFLMVL